MHTDTCITIYYTYIIILIKNSIKKLREKSLENITYEDSCPYSSSFKHPDIMMRKVLIFFPYWQ